MNRRTYLVALGSLTTTAIAGCSDEEPTVEEDDDAPANETTPDSTGEDGSDDSGTEPTDDEPQTFEFGETVEFSNEDEQLSVRPHSARLTDVVVSNTGSFLQSRQPENGLFLLLDLSMTNDGDQSTRVPQQLQLVADSTQYDRTQFILTSEQAYSNYAELRPGVTEEAVVAFDIQETDSEATLFADWGNFVDPVTAEWRLDLGTVERATTDLTNLSVGRAAEIGSETAKFQIGVPDRQFSQTYSYEGFGGTQTRRAASGWQWALVGVRAENTGERSVSVPTRFDMRIVADGQQYTPTFSQLNNAYSGGEIGTSVTTDGVVVFEIPDRVSDPTMQIDLTTDLTATWTL